jgi:crotonobetainyl-CoA:carnitine CoA-transferase CaiB-like acyl-CoA transferase
MADVFDGIRVVEVASGIAGPYAAMYLADHGAEVLKLEPPGGDPYRREPGFQTINRNKQSVVVEDPGDPAQPLLATADLIVCDRPGQADLLRAAQPGAVIITMPPWGERGPLVDHPATPDLLAAATGVMWNQMSYGEVPVKLVLPVIPYVTGVLGALAAAAGLLARERFGAAPTYEVSGVAGAAALQIGDFVVAGDDGERPGYAPMGSKGKVACYRLFQASDGAWFFLACGTRRFYERLCALIERPDLLVHPLLAEPPWGLMAEDAIEFVAPIFEQVFGTRTRAEWLDALWAADIPAQPVQTRDEFLRSDLARANGLDVAVAHPDLGEVRMMGLPVVLERTPGQVRRHAPRLDEHDDRVHRPGRGQGQGPPPLQGLRVVDVSSFIAGPVISRHLAMLGADAVKVEPPGGDPFRTIGPLFFGWNQGKRSIVLDLAGRDDQQVLHGLVRGADIVIENFRPGVADRLGADLVTLARINPDLVVLSSPGYGDDESMAHLPAFDPLLQALGGVMAAQGDDDEPVFLTAAVHDVMTPLLAAFGIVSALLHRERTGEAQRVRTALARTTVALQAAELTRYQGSPSPAVGGFDFAGPDDGHTCRPADEGWEYVDGPHSVAVSTRSLVAEPIALENGLVTTQDMPGVGQLRSFGQLVGGAGPHPARAPLLDEHGAQLRLEAGAVTLD